MEGFETPNVGVVLQNTNSDFECVVERREVASDSGDSGEEGYDDRGYPIVEDVEEGDVAQWDFGSVV